MFPLVTGSLLVTLSLLKLAARQEPEATPSMTSDDLPDIFATASRAEWISAVGWMTGFFVMLWLLGALVAVPLFALAYLLAVSRQSPVLAGGYALVSWTFVYGLFDRILHIPLPAGVLMKPGFIFPIT